MANESLHSLFNCGGSSSLVEDVEMFVLGDDARLSVEMAAEAWSPSFSSFPAGVPDPGRPVTRAYLRMPCPPVSHGRRLGFASFRPS